MNKLFFGNTKIYYASKNWTHDLRIESFLHVHWSWNTLKKITQDSEMSCLELRVNYQQSKQFALGDRSRLVLVTFNIKIWQNVWWRYEQENEPNARAHKVHQQAGLPLILNLRI